MGRSVSWAELLLVGGLLAACGSRDEGVNTPYRPGDVTAIGEEKGGEESRLGEDCSGVECDAVAQQCDGDAAADVILDKDGNVVEVICYRQDVNVEDVSIDQVDSANAGNNTVLVLDGEDDELDVTGDLTIEGNNAVVYGEGPDVSVIGGTLEIEKNNAIVRGVRIQDDVTIVKNDTKLVFCVIEGDLTITGNNTTVAECDVWGNVHITGLNTVLVQDRFAAMDSIEGFNLTCNGNLKIDDHDGDFVVDDGEVGDEITCVEAEGSPDPQSDPTESAPEVGMSGAPAAR